MAGIWLYFSGLDQAHHLVQDMSSGEGCFWHAILHRQEPDAGNSAMVTSDLSSFTLAAIDSAAGSSTKMVADCPHLSIADADVTTGTLPLQYVAP